METELNNRKDKFKYLKITTIICLIAVTLSFAGCGANGKGPSTPSTGSGTAVAAPVAGTLLRYAVAEGAAVQPDTTIIIIESMKMELEIKAGAAGKVHFIAATGAQIAQGQTVAQIQ